MKATWVDATSETAVLRIAIYILMVIASVSFATGCSSTVPSGIISNGDWLEPQWMAIQRQEIEDGAARMYSCMRDAGWKITLNRDFTFSSQGGLSQDEQLRQQRDVVGCMERASGPYRVLSDADWRVRYSKALSTADCLRAKGFLIPEAPSEDSWVDAGMRGDQIWTPFFFVQKAVENGSVTLSPDAYYELFSACPQAGPTVTWVP
jgi:hypothetical protein